MDDDDHDYDDETADGESLRLSDDGYMYVTHLPEFLPILFHVIFMLSFTYFAPDLQTTRKICQIRMLSSTRFRKMLPIFKAG